MQVDPGTGTLTPVVDLSSPGVGFGLFDNFGNLATDSRAQRLFVQRTISDFTVDPPTTEIQILTISPGAATFAAGPDLTQPLDGIAFDSANSLFGIIQCCPGQLVRVDLTTGSETLVANLVGDAFSPMAINPSTHTLYVVSISHSTFPSPTRLLSVDTVTGAVSTSPVLNRGVVGLVFDPSPGTLFGATFCCFDSFIVKIAPSTGTETTITEITGTELESNSATIDPATHTIYVLNSISDPELGSHSYVMSINDQTGASTTGLATTEFIGSFAFLPAPVSITADSIKADVKSALASGAINNDGVASSLLAELNAASAAQSRGQCATAAVLYTSFINDVNAQSGKHIAAATAAQLVSEAQFLIANCP